MTTNTRRSIDMTYGSLFPKLVAFTIPLIITNVLQLLYHAADMIVVGQFAGPQALSAVGSTGAISNLIVNCFTGLSVGAGVTISRYFGARDAENISKTLHTAIATAILGSLIAGVIGFTSSRFLLELMGSPPDVIDGATLYMRIYFIGMPFNLVYNFGAAMLRAVGDTKRPLKILSFAGVINVLLNLFFVVVLQISVAGVALATITSQAVSSFLVIKYFLKGETELALDIKKIKIHKEHFKKIISIGLPAGIQGSLFSLSNATIQSAVNSFGSIAVAGNVAGANIGGFLYTVMNCISQSVLTSSGQNIGAKNYKRAKSSIFYGASIVVLASVICGVFFYTFAEVLVGFYSSDPEVIAIGVSRLRLMSMFYVFCGFMDLTVGQLRGMGSSLPPTIISLIGVCLFRLIWVATIFPLYGTLISVYWSYPITWAITSFANFILYLFVAKRFPNEDFGNTLEHN